MCGHFWRDCLGEIIEVICTYDTESRGGISPDGRKVKGTIQWVDAHSALPFEARVYDRLFSSEDPEDVPEGEDFTLNLNPESNTRHTGALIERSVGEDSPDTRYQFERLGYYWRDPVDSRDDALIFNRIVTLRDSWAKKRPTSQAPKPEPVKRSKANATSESERVRPSKRTKSELRAKARSENPALQASFERMQTNLGLSEDDADVLAGDAGLAALYEEAAAVHGDAQAVAKWVRNELLGALKGAPASDLPFKGEAIAELVALIDAGTISGRASKAILEVMIESGTAPTDLVDALGLRQVTDNDAIEASIAKLIEANPDKVNAYRAGRKQLFGFFMGQTMKDTGGRADPKIVQSLVKKALD